MTKISQLVAMIALACVVHTHTANAAIKSSKQHYNYPGKRVFYDNYSFKDGNLVYAVCDDAKSCTVIQKHYPSDDKSQKSCDVSLEPYQDNANLTDDVHVVAFGRDNAILFWNEIGPLVFFKLSTFEMDGCNTGGLAFLDPNMVIYDQLRFDDKIVTYDDTFEIFVKNGNLSSGDEETEKVMTVNSLGFVDKSLTDFLKSGKYTVRNIAAIGNSSDGKSYVYTKELADQYLLVIRKADGSEKVLSTKNNTSTFYNSFVNGLITLCEREGLHTMMTCTQYDKEGDVKFNVTFDHDNFKQKLAPRDLYNLPDGGFLMAISEYAKTVDEVDYTKTTDYVIKKVNKHGNIIGSIHLKELVDADNAIKTLVDTRIWKNGNEGYCAAVIGQGVNQTNVNDNLSVVVNCFTDADLTE